MFVQSIEFVTWVKAKNRATGMTVEDYVAMPVQGIWMVPGSSEEERFEFTLMIRPDGAVAIVSGIAELLNGPPPPEFDVPGSN